MRAGFAAEDGVALHFRRTRLKHVVSSRPDGCAYRVEHAGDGVVETPLKVSYLGADPGRAAGEPGEPSPESSTTSPRTARRRKPRRPSAPKTAARPAGPEPVPA